MAYNDLQGHLSQLQSLGKLYTIEKRVAFWQQGSPKRQPKSRDVSPAGKGCAPAWYLRRFGATRSQARAKIRGAPQRHAGCDTVGADPAIVLASVTKVSYGNADWRS